MGSAYDLLVIGSGPGGYAAALTAARRGLKVGLIEREAWGGVCLNVGCIPTKALLAVASFVRRLRRADRFGVRVDGYHVDYAAVHARNAELIAGLRRGLTEVLQREGVALIAGTASFEDPHRVRVAQERGRIALEAGRFILATGARPSPGPWTFDEQRLLSYRGVLALAQLPASLLVIGGGVIGCEFASLFAAFGTKVTVVEQQPQLLPMEEPEAVRWLVRRLEADGVTLATGTTVTRLDSSAAGVAATLSDGSRQTAERCVIAIGQQPNLEALQLASAGVAFGRGITVDAHRRTSQPHIAAIGDCIEGHGLAHWASVEGGLAVRHLLGDPAAEALEAHDVPRCIFTDPEIAHIGLTETEAGERARASRVSFAALGKSHCDDDTDGFVKLVVDRATDRVLGATIVGAHASSLIHYAVLALHHGLTARQLAQTITAHPTLPEGVTEAAAHLYGESLVLASRRPRMGQPQAGSARQPR